MTAYTFVGKFAVKTPCFATLADQREYVAPLVEALKNTVPRYKGMNLDHISEDEFATILENEGSCPTVFYFSLEVQGDVRGRVQKLSKITDEIISVVESCGFSVEENSFGYA